MERSYLFYDIETSGLNKAFDQVLQFAAIRTDPELNELERHEIIVKLNPDCIPAPQAMVTHRIPFSRLSEEGIPELDAIGKIHALLNTPGTMSVGYNTMGFDDEFLRFSFFRNLLPPYSHQYANNCCRFDIFPITVAYYLFNPDVLSWPQIDGKVSMKLENLNSANQFTEGMAHDAMVDVIATMRLANQLKTSPQMWQYLVDSFDKEIDHQRIAKLTSAFHIQHHQFKQAVMIDASFGFDAKYQSAVLCLGRHNHYKNQSLWLRLDNIEFTNLTSEDIIEHAWVINKKPGDAKLLLPTIDRFLKYMNEDRQALIDRNLAWIQSNIPEFREISRHHLDYTHPKIPNVDADAALYQMGFLLPHETQLCQSFHAATPLEKVQLISQFNNPILREQAIRILGRNMPELLTDNLKAEFDNYMAMIGSDNDSLATVDYRGKRRLTAHSALDEVEKTRAEMSLDAQQQQLLEEYEAFIDSKFLTPEMIED